MYCMVYSFFGVWCLVLHRLDTRRKELKLNNTHTRAHTLDCDVLFRLVPSCLSIRIVSCAFYLILGPWRDHPDSLLLPEPGGGGVRGGHVPVHEAPGLPGLKDLHPHHLQRSVPADPRRGAAAVRQQ